MWGNFTCDSCLLELRTKLVELEPAMKTPRLFGNVRHVRHNCHGARTAVKTKRAGWAKTSEAKRCQTRSRCTSIRSPHLRFIECRSHLYNIVQRAHLQSCCPEVTQRRACTGSVKPSRAQSGVPIMKQSCLRCLSFQAIPKFVQYSMQYSH